MKLVDWREPIGWAIAIGVIVAIRSVVQPLLTVLLIVAVVSGILAAFYLTRIWSEESRGPDDWVFRDLVREKWRSAIAGAWVGILSALFFLGSPIPRDISSPITTVVALVLLTPGVVWAVTVWRRRRRAHQARNGL